MARAPLSRDARKRRQSRQIDVADKWKHEKFDPWQNLRASADRRGVLHNSSCLEGTTIVPNWVRITSEAAAGQMGERHRLYLLSNIDDIAVACVTAQRLWTADGNPMLVASTHKAEDEMFISVTVFHASCWAGFLILYAITEDYSAFWSVKSVSIE